MKYLADESVDLPIVHALRKEGFTIDSILEISPGISDPKVLQRASNSSAILLTCDKDFGEIAYRQKMFHFGIILIRLHGLPIELKAAKGYLQKPILRIPKLRDVICGRIFPADFADYRR